MLVPIYIFPPYLLSAFCSLSISNWLLTWWISARKQPLMHRTSKFPSEHKFIYWGLCSREPVPLAFENTMCNLQSLSAERKQSKERIWEHFAATLKWGDFSRIKCGQMAGAFSIEVLIGSFLTQSPRSLPITRTIQEKMQRLVFSNFIPFLVVLLSFSQNRYFPATTNSSQAETMGRSQKQLQGGRSSPIALLQGQTLHCLETWNFFTTSQIVVILIPRFRLWTLKRLFSIMNISAAEINSSHFTKLHTELGCTSFNSRCLPSARIAELCNSESTNQTWKDRRLPLK